PDSLRLHLSYLRVTRWVMPIGLTARAAPDGTGRAQMGRTGHRLGSPLSLGQLQPPAVEWHPNLGLRIFGSPLLTEQIIGRGPGRVSYEARRSAAQRATGRHRRDGRRLRRPLRRLPRPAAMARPGQAP